MSNYTVNILKQMINAGVSQKPADCPQELWDQANIQDAQFEAVADDNQEATGTEVATVDAFETSYPSSYGLDSFGANAAPITVDAMLKIKSGTLMLNGKEIVKAPFRAKLLIGESKFKRSIKCSVNNQVQYFSTYGNGLCTNGMKWVDVVNKCKALDPSAYEYDSADLCFELIDSLKGMDGSVVAGEGQRIGYTTSSTNKSELVRFKETCKERGFNLANAEVEVQVGFKLNTNTKNQNWTTITLAVL